MVHFNNNVLHCYYKVLLLSNSYTCILKVLIPSMVNLLLVRCTYLGFGGRAQNKMGALHLFHRRGYSTLISRFGNQ